MHSFVKKTAPILTVALAFAVISCASGVRSGSIHRASSLPATTPWNLAELSKTPQFEWLQKGDGVWSLMYQGEPFKGKPTRVFAYYATPGTLHGDITGDHALPCVVLVHGGGGHAFKEWAEMWAKRGYAAIAMDLAGCGPDEKPLPDGGPGQSDEEKFQPIDGPVTDMWTYHAVADVIRAHSLARSFPEVDPSQTAITGISWGGYLTCIVSGLDNRFRAVVPVYGCGFLAEDSFWTEILAAMPPAKRERWISLFDPSRYVGSASMPMFFIDGTNDFAYPLDSYAKTYSLVHSPREYRITVGMKHSHQFGWDPPEIAMFIDSRLRDGVPLPRVGTPVLTGNAVKASVDAKTGLTSASFHYTTDTGTMNQRTWLTRPARIEKGAIIADPPPAGATIWFLTVKDERGAVVSSELVFGK